jgi:hypothetical protein
MERTCDDCAAIYDDAERSTICPHGRFLSPELQAQKDLAISLIGKTLRWANEPGGETLRIQSVGWNGLVTLVGWSGEFAPHCFRVVIPQPEEGHEEAR